MRCSPSAVRIGSNNRFIEAKRADSSARVSTNFNAAKLDTMEALQADHFVQAGLSPADAPAVLEQLHAILAAGADPRQVTLACVTRADTTAGS